MKHFKSLQIFKQAIFKHGKIISVIIIIINESLIWIKKKFNMDQLVNNISVMIRILKISVKFVKIKQFECLLICKRHIDYSLSLKHIGHNFARLIC